MNNTNDTHARGNLNTRSMYMGIHFLSRFVLITFLWVAPMVQKTDLEGLLEHTLFQI